MADYLNISWSAEDFLNEIPKVVTPTTSTKELQQYKPEERDITDATSSSKTFPGCYS